MHPIHIPAALASVGLLIGAAAVPAAGQQGSPELAQAAEAYSEEKLQSFARAAFQ